MMHHRCQRVGNRTVLLAGGLALLLVSLLYISSALAQDPLTDTYPFYQNEAIANAVPYLQTQQQEDGGMDSFGSGSDPGGTARVVYALNAVGYPTDAIQTGDGTTMIDFLETTVISYTYANDTPADDTLFPGRAGLVLAAVSAAGEDTTSFGGVNLVDAINATLKPTGAYSTTAVEGFSSGAASSINQSLAIFGLVAAGQPVPQDATDWLIDAQGDDGSWFGGNSDITSYCIIALIGSGNVPPTDASIQDAIAFLRSQQTASSALWNDTGEFGEPANSTGWAMTALATAGYMPVTESWATGGTNPQQALLGLQNAEGIIAGTFENAYSTLEALYGLTAQPLYMAPSARTERALSWMAEQQNSDGGWSSFGTASDPGATIDIVLAFAAAGYDPTSITNGGNSPLGYLEDAATSYTRDDTDIVFPAQTGKLIAGVVATGGDPTSYGADSLSLVADLQSTLQPTGAYSTTAARGFSTGAASATTQSFAMLGLVAAGETVPQSAIDWLLGEQQADGSWGSIDATGIALQALLAAGVSPSDDAIGDAIGYLRDTQASSGGWQAFGAFSTNSTAYAIQGLLAAGVDLSGSDWLKQGRSPLDVLGSYQKPDGPFAVNWNYAGISEAFNPTADDLFATRQALPALLGSFFPYTDIPETLQVFEPIQRGPDPDRTVVAQPFGSFSGDETSVNVTVPFGSDLNGNNEVELEWRVAGGSFTSISATREVGFYSATIDLTDTDITPLDTLEFCVSFSDPDGVQNGSTITTDEDICGTEQPNQVYLPLITTGTAANGSPDQNRAGVVVRFGDGTVETACVAFSEEQITGVELLQRSSLVVEIAESPGLGAAVCKIGNDGCPADSCFCDADNFWKYFLGEDGSWSSSLVGASSRTVQAGDLDGWQWTAIGDEAATPTDISFAEVCPGS